MLTTSGQGKTLTASSSDSSLTASETDMVQVNADVDDGAAAVPTVSSMHSVQYEI